jgi:hypothetical protein
MDLWALSPEVFQDGVSFTARWRDHLAVMAMQPSRDHEDIALGAARYLVELLDPDRKADAKALGDGTKGLLDAYLEQALAAIRPSKTG